ncbi:MAG: aminoacyl-tRNA hydrolase [Methylohalobius sp. ZOD2]
MNCLSLLVGLGNPDSRYLQTRHNAGFWFLDEVARRCEVGFVWQPRFGGWVAKFHCRGEVVHLLKPGQYMNRSGGPVAAYCRYYQISPERILVAHDELDFAPGKVRLKWGGGHGGHNGLRDIVENLKSKQFYRLRIGIGRPARGSVVDYVLGRPGEDEEAEIRARLARAADCLPKFMEEGPEKAMNLLHSAEEE